MVSHRFAKPASIIWHEGSTPSPSAFTLSLRVNLMV